MLTIFILSSILIFALRGGKTQNTCVPHKRLSNADFVMENNVWGRCNSSNSDCITNFSQCINIKRDKSSTVYEWSWNWPHWPDKRVKASPEIIYGWKPWDTQSTTSTLPRKIADINSLSVSFDISGSATGIYDLGIDMWVTSSPLPSPANRKCEIMVLLDSSHWHREGDNKVSIGEDEYYFDSRRLTMNGKTWQLIIFHKIIPKYKGTLNIQDFLNYLLEKGRITSTEFLATVELMNEIKEGSGKTTIKDYVITIS